MLSKITGNTLLALASVLILFSCEKSGTDTRAKLSFSDDTVYFDTVFSTLGSTTRELRVKNTERGKITIAEISLAGRSSSHFRLNIDGVSATKVTDVELEGGDSLFIFVDALIDPLNSDSPVAVTDSVLFRLSGQELKVHLLAWGQDINLIDRKTIGSETWDGSKPYLIYGSVFVDTLETLTIEKGARIYFHKNASMIVAGNIIASGTSASPVLMASDRTENMYEDVPGQWSGIYLLNTSRGNRINNVTIRNSVNGICLGETSNSAIPPELKLFNTTIRHSTITALSVIKGNIEAVNTVFSHCGKYCIYIRGGGNYSFIHCTVFNVWDYGFRTTPSLFISEKPAVAGGTASQLYLDISSSVVYGDNPSEISILPVSKGYSGNYLFDHCLLRLDTNKSGFWSRDRFHSVKVNENPRFIDHISWDFRPDTLSPLIDMGNPLYLIDFPIDIRGASRSADGHPDAGAYERIPGEKRKPN